MKMFFVRFAIFIVLSGLVFLGGFAFQIEPGPQGRMASLLTAGKLFLHKYSLVGKLTLDETEKLYLSKCNGACHGREVVEKSLRTPLEWKWIVTRMGVADQADLSKPQIDAITRYLERYYLSKVPTTLPEKTMRFVKKHLWRLDLGEGNITLDVIYIPQLHRSLMPYLAFKSSPTTSKESLFIIYMNTHRGSLPEWDFLRMATIKDSRGRTLTAKSWDLLYQDGQNHHRQGILTFPEIDPGDKSSPTTFEMLISQKGMREKKFLWHLPIPDVKISPKILKEEVKS